MTPSPSFAVSVRPEETIPRRDPILAALGIPPYYEGWALSLADSTGRPVTIWHWHGAFPYRSAGRGFTVRREGKRPSPVHEWSLAAVVYPVLEEQEASR